MTTTNPNMRNDEFVVLAAIVDAALDAGHRVSVYDGEGWAIFHSTDRAAILDACGTTDADTLRIRGALGVIIGSATLVYGNEPGVLIADHTDSEAMAQLLARACAMQDAISAAA